MDSRLINSYKELEDNHWWWQSRRNIVNTALLKWAPKKNLKILDVGCGSGATFENLPVDAQPFGLEPNPKALELCELRNIPGVEIGRSFNDFKNFKFDVIFLLDVLEHCDESVLLEDVYARLDQDGVVLLTVPAFPWLWTSWDDFNNHKRRYTRRSLRKAMERSGFKVDYCSYFNFFLFPLALLRKLILAVQKKPMVVSRVPNSIINSIFRFIFSLEKYFISKKMHFPFGSSLILSAKIAK